MANSSTQLNDDATDLSTLQAQIDLSMSVAHDMISSWVKPSKQQVARPKKDDVEEILKEYIHRPPRLGVGATIPECHNNSLLKEAAQLKNRLTQGNVKRSREEILDSSRTALVDADDEESRARAIIKKARVDPFEAKNKKRKKAKGATLPFVTAPAANVIDKRNDDVSPLRANNANDSDEDGDIAMAEISTDDKRKAVPPSEQQRIKHPTGSSIPIGLFNSTIPVLNLGDTRSSPILSDVQDTTAKKKRKRRKRKKRQQGDMT